MSMAVKVKFCGITSLKDAREAVEAGAWAIGLIFWPHSPRRCELDAAAEIAAALKRRVEIAGVFVNQPLDEVCGLAEGIGLTLVQLHGDEGPSFCAEAARRSCATTRTFTCSTATAPACRAARGRRSRGTSRGGIAVRCR